MHATKQPHATQPAPHMSSTAPDAAPESRLSRRDVLRTGAAGALAAAGLAGDALWSGALYVA